MCLKGLLSVFLRVVVAEADANSFQNRNVFRPARSLWNLINHFKFGIWPSNNSAPFCLRHKWSSARPIWPPHLCWHQLEGSDKMEEQGETWIVLHFWIRLSLWLYSILPKHSSTAVTVTEPMRGNELAKFVLYNLGLICCSFGLRFYL